MTAHVPMARVPFAPLDNPRLQHLAAAKNRQNGLIAEKSLNGKMSDKKALFSPASKSTVTKRSFETTNFDIFDSENIDPAVLDSPSKKTKTFAFSMTSAKTMPPPPAPLSTPVRANISSPRAPLTAPAGRSPKRKILGMGKSRRVSAPFSRIDPPFAYRSTSSMPFSLDAALKGTFDLPGQGAGATIQESMPKSWFFDIHEDTPGEEAANLMEHSTLTLDLSSDDEGNKRERDDRGKENTPPEGYDAPAASRPAGKTSALPVKKIEVTRIKAVTDEMDDGQRSPLSDLETEPFFSEGCDKNSHVVVDAPFEKEELLAKPAALAALKPVGDKATVTPVINAAVDAVKVAQAEKDASADFVIWEDGAA